MTPAPETPEKTDGPSDTDPDPDPDTTFPQFGRLPPELRLIVWEMCLPQRVIPLSILVLAQQHGVTLPTTSRTTTDSTASKNDTSNPAAVQRTKVATRISSPMSNLIKSTLARPSIISQVCQESRAVVLARQIPWYPTNTPTTTTTTISKTKQQHQADGESKVTGTGTDNSTAILGRRPGCIGWFDPRTDTLLVDCDVRGRYASLWERVRSELLFLPPQDSTSQARDDEEAASQMVARGGGRQGLRVALKRHEVGRWFRSEGKKEDGEETGPGYDGVDEGKPSSAESVGTIVRGPRVGCMLKLVVAEVQVHVTPDEARASGLFGLFAEERFAFLDLLDKRSVDRLLEIQDKASAVRKVCEVMQHAFKLWSKVKRSLDPRSAPLDGASEEGPGSDDEELAQDQARSIMLGVWPVIHVERSDIARMK